MQRALKTRLIGAAVLIAIAVIVVPTFFSAKPPGGSGHSISLDIPAPPEAQFKTRILEVGPGSGAAAVPAQAASVAAVPSSAASASVPVPPVPQVAAGGEAGAAKVVTPPAATHVTSAPVATKPAAGKPAAPSAPAAKPAVAKAPAANAATSAPGRAADVTYMLRLGAYADHASADKVQAKAALAGYRTHMQTITSQGKHLRQVSAGPFTTRAAAEAARLRLDAQLHGVQAKVDTVVADQQGDTSPATAAATQAGGWAVQLIAYSHRSDADTLRKRLHAAGFDAYVDSVKVHGKTLWRVRAGPRIKRADADTLRSAITARFPKLKGVLVALP